jgi:hypothetical protein
MLTLTSCIFRFAVFLLSAGEDRIPQSSSTFGSALPIAHLVRMLWWFLVIFL